MAPPPSMPCACCGPVGFPSSSSMSWRERPHLPPSCTYPPAWSGFTTIRDTGRLERLVGKLRMGYLSEDVPRLLKWWSLLKSGCLEQCKVLHHSLTRVKS